MDHSPNRIEVVRPGHGIAPTDLTLFYAKLHSESSKLFEMFQGFDNKLWSIIAISILGFTLLFTLVDIILGNPSKCVIHSAAVNVGMAFIGQCYLWRATFQSFKRKLFYTAAG